MTARVLLIRTSTKHDQHESCSPGPSAHAEVLPPWASLPLPCAPVLRRCFLAAMTTLTTPSMRVKALLDALEAERLTCKHREAELVRKGQELKKVKSEAGLLQVWKIPPRDDWRAVGMRKARSTIQQVTLRNDQATQCNGHATL